MMKTKFSLIFLFFVLNILSVAQDIKVISSTASSIVIQYVPVFKDTVYTSSQGQQYVSFNIAGTYIENISTAGMPQIQVRSINIGVPTEFGNTIQILNADYSNFSGLLLPTPELKKDSVSFSNVYSSGANYYKQLNVESVSFGDFGMIRELPVQTFKIHPVQFDASGRTIKLLKSITFKITFAASKSSQQLIKDSHLASTVLNWNVAKNWGTASAKLRKVQNSILASGSWYRFETPTEGIYKIDQTFLKNLGIDISSIDPRTIKIYGMGGYALPEDPTTSNNQGLVENAILVNGESDGHFDSGDYVLFYGRPPEFWEYNKTSRSIGRVKDPYSKVNYYWLTYGGSNGKRMNQKQSLNIDKAYQQQTTQAFQSWDKDSINIGKTGRDYLGDVFDSFTKSRTYITSLSGIVPSTPVNYKVRVVNASTTVIPYTIEESGSQIYANSVYGGNPSLYLLGNYNISNSTYTGSITDERSALKITNNSGSTDAQLYLDYFEIRYTRQLKAANDNLLFFSKDTSAVIQYVLSNFSNSSIQTFDVTDFANVQIVSNANVSGGQYAFQANETSGKVAKYLAVTNSQYLTPVNGTKMGNSDIRGNVSGSEMIVIAPRDFQAQAERYVAYRSNQSPYKVSTQVFYVNDIMNEFAGGLLDPTAIRDFLKYAYDNWQIKPFYVLLFGNGTYDYLNKEKANNNFIPTFQTPESLDEINSYPYDDYYARVSGNDKKADFAMGRLPIRSTDDAENDVDKIIKYETGMSKGLWRNTITLVADDGPAAQGADDGNSHTAQSEMIANQFLPKYFDQNKIYLVAYPTVYTGLGRRKPEVNKAIINAINNGTLIMNWVGHGNPDVWAHEDVFDKATTIPQIKNTNYFFLTAATCDFGRYDDPSQQSSAEIMVNMKNTGAIGCFTAARVVYSTDNAIINDSLYSNMFFGPTENNLPTRIGTAYFLTKQVRTATNDEKYHLLCDPALRLDEPQIPSRIDSVNGKSLQASVQISALGNVTVKGTVRNYDGSLNQFTGNAILSVFDSEQIQYYDFSNYPHYAVPYQGGLIYRGSVSINNGNFHTEFVVPKDISYENQNGKITSYVFNDNADGIGYTDNIIVGGTDPNAKNDGKGPDVKIAFDDPNFGDGNLVNPDFILYAKISDASGLNTTGTGIGHKMQAVINGDEANAIDLTNYFVGDLDSGGKSGVVKYSFTGMQPGQYDVKVNAWDVFNNFSSKDASFTVVNSNAGITVQDVYNYPNPFSSNTTFTFQHNYNDAVNVKIKIYTVAGRMIKEVDAWDVMDRFVRVDWDGRDNDGNRIANGTYLYKLLVESVDGKFRDNVLGKLAVIR